MMKLFYFPSTCALAVHILLEEAGANYEAVSVDFMKGEQRSPEYLAINPKGRVPALATDQGILTEVPALLAYVSQVYPDAKLAPSDPFKFAQAQEFNAYLCATLHVAHAHIRRGNRWADEQSSFDDMKQKGTENVGAAFDLIENGMLQGKYVLGEDYSICDPYLFTVARWLDPDGVPETRHPRVRTHMAMMAERPAVKAALAAEGLS